MCTLVSPGPVPGSKLTNAPAVGLRVPYQFGVPSVPLNPFNDMFLIPEPLRT